LEADEVVDVEDGRRAGSVAVGVVGAGREGGLEADEVVDVEDRGGGGAVAVGVTGRRVEADAVEPEGEAEVPGIGVDLDRVDVFERGSALYRAGPLGAAGDRDHELVPGVESEVEGGGGGMPLVIPARAVEPYARAVLERVGVV